MKTIEAEREQSEVAPGTRVLYFTGDKMFHLAFNKNGEWEIESEEDLFAGEGVADE